MKITKTRFEKFIDDSNLIFNNFDTQFHLHRALKFDENKILGISMETGYLLSRLTGETHIWINDLNKHPRDRQSDIYRGNNYDELLKINLRQLIEEMEK